ncbi:hypothetical protein LB507_008948, partial [Fusarium sp. FIESC RH6]
DLSILILAAMISRTDSRNETGFQCSHASTIAAILATVATQYLFSREQELWSEFICWACLPLMVKANPMHQDSTPPLPLSGATRPARPLTLWAVAGCLGISSICQAETNCSKLMPALTPLLILARKSSIPQGVYRSGETLPVRLAKDPIAAALIAVCQIGAIPSWSYRDLLSSSVGVCASFVVYAAFLSGAGQKCIPALPAFESAVRSLAPSVMLFLFMGLAVRISVLGPPPADVIHALLLGVMKAFSWRSIALTASCTSWVVGPILVTFSFFPTRSPMSFETEGQALLNVFSSLLSFLQLKGCFANGQRLKWALHPCMLLPMAPYLINLVSIYGAQHNAPAFSQPEPHPAQTLAARSKEYFRSVLSNQSSTYEAAYQEYKRRYTIVPPQGFQEWYKMANLVNTPIIDEYDSIHHSTAPLLSLSGKQIQQTILHTYQQRGADLWLCQFSKTSSSTQCRHPFRTFDRHISLLFNTLLANVTDLPDVQFLVNHIDEPRVVPHTHKAGSSQYESIAIQDYSRKPTWDLLTEVCSWDNTKADEVDDTAFLGLPFVANSSSAKDLCQHPEYSHWYGLFVSPVSFRPIRGPVPVFSTGTLSTMGDILFPSPAYIEKEFLYDASKDIDWEKKQHNLYWAGSTTGGFANKTNWPIFHRQ